jgi:phosphatidylglycerol:prolipoprotein diacylglycerol transferase
VSPEIVGVYSYFVFWPIAAVFGISTGMRLARRAGFPALRSFVALCLAAFWIFVGSKLLYLVESGLFPFDDPFPAPQHSASLLFLHGFRIPGGILLMGVASPLVDWILRLPIRRFFDATVPAAGVAIFCIRIGCLLNGCCFGAPTQFPLAMTFPPGARVYDWQVVQGLIKSTAPRSLPVHPLQVYFGLLGLVLYFLGVRWQASKRFDGEVWVNFFIVFFAGTFLLELLRPAPLHLNLILTATVAVVTGLVARRMRQALPATGLSS